MQKKYRIKNLWKKAKRVYIFQRFKFSSEPKEEDNNQDDQEDVVIKDNVVWRWWIIRQENTLPQFWNFVINTLTIYALFVTPFVLVFPECSFYLRSLELFADACFTLDIILNFLKLEDNQKEEDFPELRMNYLKSTFIFDCFAALPGLVTLE